MSNKLESLRQHSQIETDNHALIPEQVLKLINTELLHAPIASHILREHTITTDLYEKRFKGICGWIFQEFEPEVNEFIKPEIFIVFFGIANQLVELTLDPKITEVSQNQILFLLEVLEEMTTEKADVGKIAEVEKLVQELEILKDETLTQQVIDSLKANKQFRDFKKNIGIRITGETPFSICVISSHDWPQSRFIPNNSTAFVIGSTYYINALQAQKIIAGDKTEISGAIHEYTHLQRPFNRGKSNNLNYLFYELIAHSYGGGEHYDVLALWFFLRVVTKNEIVRKIDKYVMTNEQGKILPWLAHKVGYNYLLYAAVKKPQYYESNQNNNFAHVPELERGYKGTIQLIQMMYEEYLKINGYDKEQEIITWLKEDKNDYLRKGCNVIDVVLGKGLPDPLNEIIVEPW
ncbi:MAG TPA: hypothetical protein VD999_06510 [Vitreimonas sp.]|nr:hypothetical protein [Vitreimonas sp.]